jgi:hypothetical protein
MYRQSGASNIEWLKQFIVILSLFAAILAVGAYVHYYTTSETERVTWESNELLNVGLARSAQQGSFQCYFGSDFSFRLYRTTN